MNSSELATMRKAIETGNLETVKQTASETGINLVCAWAWITEDAIRYNFLNLLKYLQDDLKIDYAEKFRTESYPETHQILQQIAQAAKSGQKELVEYFVRKSESQDVFDFAFAGAVEGSQVELLSCFAEKFSDFEVNNDLLNFAFRGACMAGHSDMISYVLHTFRKVPFSLQKDDELDAVDWLLIRTLESVSLLLTGKTVPSPYEKTSLENAEQLIQLLKEYHK